MKEDSKLYLILGSHAHVPSGAADSEFEYVYENVMRPFVCNLYRYSNIQAVLHYSGVLLYWVERTHPEFFMLIEDMVSRKQAEILGGGFYEPMFPLIPLQDRIGQIELLTTYLRRHFGKRPAGCWIPCMAWEQHLAASLSASDIDYTFLTQEQFVQAGMQNTDLFYPCITEDQGKLVSVFPVSPAIGQELSEKSCSHVFIGLKNKLDEEYGFSQRERIISVFPQNVPCASEEAQDTAWNRFFEELSLSSEYVETVLPPKILKSQKTFKKASFPNSSYFENGYSPRRFLINHEEANGIYSKMIFTNVLISQLKGDKYRKQNAREELWKAQDSCLFIPDNKPRHELRKAAYSSLLRAERMSREKGKFIQSLIQHDFDFDGVKEYLFQDAVINCYIELKGAGVFELDYLPKEWNYLDCGCDEEGQRRTSFADIIIPQAVNAQDLKNGFGQEAKLCYKEEYEALSQDRKGKSCFKLSSGNIEINKCYMLKKDILVAAYSIKNTGKENIEFTFIPQINLSFCGETEELVRFYTVDSGAKDTPAESVFGATSTLKILDVKNEVQIILASINDFTGCILPVRAANLYQATSILPVFTLTLEPGKTWNNEFSLKFSH